MRNIVALFLSFLALPLSAAITGSVMTTGGQPVAGARVSIHTLEMPEARAARLLSASPERVALASTEADAQGNFSLASPKEAVVEVHVHARGYEPAMWLAEKDDDLGAVALVERPMRGGTVTRGGSPVPNALVAISYHRLFSPGGAEYLTRTDAQGRYEAPETTSPSAAITVIHPGSAIETGFASMARPGPRDMNVSLAPGTPLTGRTVAADGTTPVPNAVILLDGWPLTKSGEDGTFTIARAPQKWAYLLARTDKLAGFQPAASQRNLVIRMEPQETISGRVLDAQTKRPVAGALVYLMRSSSGPALFGLTDAKGTFAIAAPASEYRVSAFHPGYGEAVSPVKVSSGQRVADDLSLVRFARASGVVLDEEKRPVPGAMVVAQEGLNPATRYRTPFSGTSAADGRFSVRVRPDADMRLRAAKPALPPAKSAVMKLAPGQRKTGIVLTIPTGVAVTGRVVDTNDEPLSGVVVLPTETPTRGWEGGSSSSDPIDDDAVRTAKDGTFSLRLEAGTYDFALRREGFAPGHVRAQRIAADEAPPIVAKLERTVEITGRITRGGAPLAGVTIHAFFGGESSQSAEDGSFTVRGLTPGITNLVLGRKGELLHEQRRITAPARDVLIELPLGITVAGRVTDKATRSAVREFEVGIERPQGQGSTSSTSRQQFTSDDGTFTLEHVEPGAMQLVAKAAGYASARLGIDAQEGKDVRDVVLELDPPLRLSGRITAANGSPLSGVSVEWQPGPGGHSGKQPRATTNANGEYVVEGLDPGEQAFRIAHPKYTPARRTVTLTERETKLDVQLSAGHRVTGTVVDERGAPVAEAEVRASGNAYAGQPALTNAAGLFEIETLPPGRYRFVASKRGLADGVLEDVDIVGGAPLVIALRTGGTVYGRVSGVTAAELPHTTVRAQADSAYLSSPVGPQGNYRIEGLPAGKVSIAVSVSPPMSGSSRGSPPRDVQVVTGGAVQLDIELAGNAVVRGRVTRNGVPLDSGSVSFNARDRDRGSHASGRIDHEGRYAVSGLLDGEYAVSVSEPRGGRAYSTKYHVRGSGTFDIDFKTGSVRGRVVDASTGDALGNITVRFQSRNGGPFTVVTDASGTFTAPHVTPAIYTVSASGDGYAIQRREIAVRDVAAEEIELRLTKTAMTILRVVDGRDGHPLSAPTTVLDAQGRPVLDDSYRSGAVDPEQGLKLPLPPGTYTARITAIGYAPRSVTITAPSSPTVALTPGGTIRIQSKHSVPRRIRISGPDVPMRHQLRPGETVFAHLPPGTYTIELLNEANGVEDTVQVVVREGETSRAGV